MTEYLPAWWLPGPHTQTLWGKLFRRQSSHPTEVERWDTPDGDFIEIHRLRAGSAHARFLLLHGLEGTIRSHYAQGLLGEARRKGWAADMLIFRSCGEEMNRTRRFYHSGETTDLAFVLERISKENPNQLLVIAGVSLGGNVLLKYLGEQGSKLSPQVKAAAAISVPFDLSRSSQYIDHGFSRIYQSHFIRSLKRKTIAKLEKFPDLVQLEQLTMARTMHEFDDVMTAPIHGFRDAEDYYRRSSSLGWLDRISIPTLLLSAVDDPFLPAEVLDDVRSVARRNPVLKLEFTPSGGHAGFISGRNPFRAFYYAERRACDFLAEQLAHEIGLPVQPKCPSRQQWLTPNSRR
jgi:predicted alpha/beta-fold hydrolase